MDHWEFPVGTKLWKEFTRDDGMGHEVRVETRLIMRIGADDTEASWFYMPYAWNATNDDTVVQRVKFHWISFPARVSSVVKRDADNVRLANKDPDVIQIRSVAGKTARVQLAKPRSRFTNRLFALRDNKHGIAGGQRGFGGRNDIVPTFTDHRHLHIVEHAR